MPRHYWDSAALSSWSKYFQDCAAPPASSETFSLLLARPRDFLSLKTLFLVSLLEEWLLSRGRVFALPGVICPGPDSRPPPPGWASWSGRGCGGSQGTCPRCHSPRTHHTHSRKLSAGLGPCNKSDPCFSPKKLIDLKINWKQALLYFKSLLLR